MCYGGRSDYSYAYMYTRLIAFLQRFLCKIVTKHSFIFGFIVLCTVHILLQCNVDIFITCVTELHIAVRHIDAFNCIFLKIPMQKLLRNIVLYSFLLYDVYFSLLYIYFHYIRSLPRAYCSYMYIIRV